MKQRTLKNDYSRAVAIVDIHFNISSHYSNKIYLQQQQFDLQFHKWLFAHNKQTCFYYGK